MAPPMMTMDEELFLDDVAAFLDAQQPLSFALWGSQPVSDVAELLDDDAPDATRSLLRDARQSNESSNARTVLPSGPRPAKARNVSREKMQSELMQLRLQSQELQRQLAALNAHVVAPNSMQHELLLGVTWGHVARRQLELRVRAEAENRRLKAHLETQAALLRGMHVSPRLLTESGDHQAIHGLSNRSHATIATPSVCPSPDDIQIYKELLAELDDVWLQMDSVLTENGLHRLQVTASLPPQARLKSRRCPTGNQPDSFYIELIEVEVLPFERDPVFSVMWECWARHGASKNCILLEHKPEEVIASTTRVLTSFNGQDVPLEFVHVAKVYRDQDRVCYVWRGVTKADAHFPGVFVDEVGWQIMKPHTHLTSESSSSSSLATGTEILTCWQLESKSSRGGEESEPQRVSPLANLIISTAEADILEVNAKMLNMLLEDVAQPTISATV